MKKREAVERGEEGRRLDEVDQIMYQLAGELEQRANIAGLQMTFGGCYVHSEG